jgi:monoamine oxidase
MRSRAGSGFVVAKGETRTDCDVVIVGAGAAGLAAAASLVRDGLSVCVLEARDRVGGRILTRRDPALDVPLELGAELVHGTPAATIAWARKARSPLVDVAEQRWIVRRGKLERADDLFERMMKGLSAARRPRKDVAFAEFLAGAARRHLTPATRELAHMLVEGFDAADATRVSTLATLDEWAGAASADAPTFRLRNGYGALVDALVAALDRRAQLKLETVVREVRWRRGAVAIDAMQQDRRIAVRARAAIVTLPLGVLRQPPQVRGAVLFVPALDAKRKAFAGLESGAVLKVILQFASAFWEDLDDGRYRDAAFFHAPGAPFPTFWSMLPIRAPLLTAWSAGPSAARLSGSGDAAIVRAALAGLRKVFGARAAVADRLRAAYVHDWQADPFARGAYCYAAVGGRRAREKLAVPLRATLFFAGEAAATGGESGTVAGALRSGEHAAEQVLDARRQRRRGSR